MALSQGAFASRVQLSKAGPHRKKQDAGSVWNLSLRQGEILVASVTLTIRNWKKFNPRKDVANSSWFRLEHDMMESDEFFSITDSEFRAWIYILSRASKSNSETVLVDFDRAERVCRVKKASIESLLEKLLKLPEPPVSVTAPSRERNDDDTQTGTTRRDVTRRDETNDIPQRTVSGQFDFESIYRSYPRKEGKSKGLKTLRETVKTPEDFQALSQAVERFRIHHAGAKTEPQYIKHFSTWVGTKDAPTWRDWVEADAGRSESADDRARREKAELDRQEREWVAKHQGGAA